MNIGVVQNIRGLAKQDRASTEPGASLFHALRMQLTLLHTAVLAVVLAICGLVLYFSFVGLLLRPVNGQVWGVAEGGSRFWAENGKCTLTSGGFRGPDGAGRRAPLPVYIACFDLQGQPINSTAGFSGGTATVPASFLNPGLVARATRNGSASDVVQDGEETGPIYRHAVLVSDDSGPIGVIQAGQSIAQQQDALDLVRNLLLGLGVLGVLASLAGGLYLGTRALQPARLAFARQQAFIADASHELRTPLTLLRGDAEVLLRHRDRLPADDAELLEDIVAETAHMEGLATNLLTLARLDSGRQELEREVVDLSGLVSGVQRRVSTVAREKGITLTDQLSGGVLVMGDPQALEQAALILLDNAVKYTPAGGTVTVRTFGHGRDAGLVVEDTGPGMSAEQVERLGERFYRGDGARAQATSGAGLGLSIAEGIAAAHGGRLSISSAPGEGTRAALTFPLLQLPE